MKDDGIHRSSLSNCFSLIPRSDFCLMPRFRFNWPSAEPQLLSCNPLSSNTSVSPLIHFYICIDELLVISMLRGYAKHVIINNLETTSGRAFFIY
jgi:hypothetical protein